MAQQKHFALRRRVWNGVLDGCHPKPEAHFCIAIEEGEAWFLGDILAVRTAYPKAENAVLDSYINDSICGTWEKLADAVHPGGSTALYNKGWQAIGEEKSKWADAIAPHMNVTVNNSPSFRYFLETIQELIQVN